MKKFLSALIAATMLLTSFASIASAEASLGDLSIDAAVTVEEYTNGEYSELGLGPGSGEYEEIRAYHVTLNLSDFGTISHSVSPYKDTVIGGRKITTCQFSLTPDDDANVFYIQADDTAFDTSKITGWPEGIILGGTSVSCPFATEFSVGYPSSGSTTSVDGAFSFTVCVSATTEFEVAVDAVKIETFELSGTSKFNAKSTQTLIETKNNLELDPIILYGYGEGPASTPTHKAYFKANGSDFITPADVEEGAAITFPTTDPTKTDARFLGWSTDGTVANIVSSANMGTADVTYTAVFEDKVTVTFMNGSEQFAQKTGYAGEDITGVGTPTKEHYTFTGWNNDFNDKFPSADTTYTAQFTENDYVTLTFVGADPDATGKYYVGEAFPSVTPATVSGKHFTGWNPALPGDNKVPAVATTYTAQYENDTVYATASFVNEAGATVASNIQVEAGQNVTLPAIPAKTDFVATGWYDGVTLVGQPGEQITLNADKTFTCKYVTNVIANATEQYTNPVYETQQGGNYYGFAKTPETIFADTAHYNYVVRAYLNSFEGETSARTNETKGITWNEWSINTKESYIITDGATEAEIAAGTYGIKNFYVVVKTDKGVIKKVEIAEVAK